MAKTEEKLRQAIKEFYDERTQHHLEILSTKTSSLLMWGAAIGALAAYTSLLPFVLGALVGFAAARTQLPCVETTYLKITGLITAFRPMEEIAHLKVD